PDQYEFSFRSKHGNQLFGLMTASIIPGTKRTIVSIIDVTKRKMVEEALQEVNEELDKKVWEHTQDLIKSKERLNKEVAARRYVEKLFRKQQYMTLQCLDLMGLTVVSTDQEGTVLDVNKRGLQTFGYRSEEMIGKNWFKDLIPEKEAENALKIQKRVAKNGINSNISIIPVVGKAGRESALVWLAITVHDEEGYLSSILWIGEDPPGRSVIAILSQLI
ncbi:MAG: PAS domain S-box protein, partial [Methanomicrobiaceae archaeon]|nr:PAS domain S-box protein [Methanomicrobiaceae archaeon]